MDEICASTGVVLMGKRMVDVGFEPWGDPPPFGMPVFVVTHQEREPLPMQGGTTYTVATDGIGAALELGRAADPHGIELRRTSSLETPSATHLRFEVVK